METLADIYNPSVPGAGTQVGSTAPQGDDWRNIGLNIEGGGNMLAPTFQQGDWEWRDAVDPQYSYSGDSPTQISAGVNAGWYLTDAAKARLGPTWTKEDNTSIDWSPGGWNPLAQTVDRNAFTTMGDYGGGFDESGYNQALEKTKAQNPWDYLKTQGFKAKVKSADKAGTLVDFAGNNPRISGRERWDTNSAEMNMKAAAAVATLLSAGTIGPALQGLTQSIQAGVMPSLSQIGAGLSTLNTFTGGQIPGVNVIAPLTGSIGSIGDVISGGINNLGDIAKLAKGGYNVYNKGSQLMEMFSGPDERAGTGFAPRPQTGYNPPVNPTNTQGINFGDIGQLLFGGAGGGSTGLMDLYGAYRGSREGRDEAFRLQNLYNDAQARRQPVLDRLNASYTDPNTFYDSNQWKGLQSVYQNQIDRQAASKGRMANPTDREVLLNNYAMKELENYRGGLRQQAQLLNPDNYINPFMRGSTREANAANPYYALGGRGSVGGPGGANSPLEQIARLISGGSSAIGNAGSVARIMEQVFGGRGDVGMGNYLPGGDVGMPSYNPFTGYDEPVYGGDTYGDGRIDWEMGMPYTDPGYTFSDNPFTFDAGGGNGFGIGDFDVQDTSWLDDFGDWF